jgi:hypothetical protein
MMPKADEAADSGLYSTNSRLAPGSAGRREHGDVDQQNSKECEPPKDVQYDDTP